MQNETVGMRPDSRSALALLAREAMAVRDAEHGKRTVRAFPVLGHVPLFVGRSFHDVFVELETRLGEFYPIRLPNTRYFVVNSARLVPQLADETLFRKRIQGALAQVANVVGKGLFTVEGNDPLWEKARAVLQPGFHVKAMQTYHEGMRTRTLSLLAHWERAARASQDGTAVVAPVEDFTHLTLEIISLCGFGYALDLVGREGGAHPFVKALGDALFESGRRVMRPKIAKPFARAAEKKYRADIQALYAVVDKILDARLEEKRHGNAVEHPDLLQLMLSATDESGEPVLPRENIREQLLTFLVAGHETTSGLLSFASGLLASHPHVTEKIFQECEAVFGARADEDVGFQDVLKLRYVQAVLSETLRLWPTASTFSVVAQKDVVLGGIHPILEGERVVVSLWNLHRDPEAWGDDAELFRPERFLVPSDAQPKHAYKPFGNASRSCIGRFFALHEAALALALLVRRFHIEPSAGYPFRIAQQLTIKPAGLRVRLTPRSR